TAQPTAEPTAEPTTAPSPAPSVTGGPAGGPRGGDLANTGSGVDGSPLPAIGIGMLALGLLVAAGTVIARRRTQQ
ncbi:hypothetical protein HR12_02655, partial [Microbacterium sp. SUBG005]